MARRKVLIVDDEQDMRWLLRRVLKVEGFDTLTAEDGEVALAVTDREAPDVILLDVRMPRLDGLTTLEQLRARGVSCPVIMVTAVGEVGTAVQSLRLGAHDYLVKPFNNQELVSSVSRALEQAPVRSSRPSWRLAHAGDLRALMGTSEAIGRVIEQVEHVAPTSYTVLLEGETGTGKELVARALHHLSTRRHKPFVPVDCGAIPDGLVEAELFGHEKGTFTGAHERRAGLVPSAAGGTLFLDEVANLPAPAQMKLLRLLQEREVRALGSRHTMAVDVRVVAASNVPLADHVRAGRFRSDLLYRLSEFHLALPPLRGRRADVPILARNFCDEACTDLGRPPLVITTAAMDVLMRHDWPGNARELRNVMRRAALLAQREIEPRHLSLGVVADGSPLDLEQAWDSLSRGIPLADIVQQVSGAIERELIARMLVQTGHNKLRAAETLQIDYKTLFRKLEKYGLA